MQKQKVFGLGDFFVAIGEKKSGTLFHNMIHVFLFCFFL